MALKSALLFVAPLSSPVLLPFNSPESGPEVGFGPEYPNPFFDPSPPLPPALAGGPGLLI